MNWGEPSRLGRFDLGQMAYGPIGDLAEQRAAVHASIAGGAGFFDTAGMYGNGASECAVGTLTRGTPALIATKFPSRLLSSGAQNLHTELEGSLSRLERRFVDLYQVHSPFPWLSIPRVMAGMAEAVRQGKIGAVGVCNFSAQQLRLAHRVLADEGVPLASNQVEYSLLRRSPETNGVLQACSELGVTLIAYMPLAMGALTGSYADGRRPRGFRRFLSVFRARASLSCPLWSVCSGRSATRAPKPRPGRTALVDSAERRTHTRREERRADPAQRWRALVFAHERRARSPRSRHHRLPKVGTDLDHSDLYTAVHWTARVSALLFAAALGVPVLFRVSERRSATLYLAFILAHTVHFSFVIWLAKARDGARMFPGARHGGRGRMGCRVRHLRFLLRLGVPRPRGAVRMEARRALATHRRQARDVFHRLHVRRYLRPTRRSIPLVCPPRSAHHRCSPPRRDGGCPNSQVLALRAPRRAMSVASATTTAPLPHHVRTGTPADQANGDFLSLNGRRLPSSRRSAAPAPTRTGRAFGPPPRLPRSRQVAGSRRSRIPRRAFGRRRPRRPDRCTTQEER